MTPRPHKRVEFDLQEWRHWLVKGVIGLLFWFGNNSLSALNTSIKDLGLVLNSIQVHQIETDKRIAAVETAREANLPRYLRMEQDFEVMKQDIAVNKAHVEEIFSFLGRRVRGTK